MTPMLPHKSVDFTDAELDAVTDILGRAIEPHACISGTVWHSAWKAWEKCAIARGTLEPEDDLDA